MFCFNRTALRHDQICKRKVPPAKSVFVKDASNGLQGRKTTTNASIKI